MLAFLCITVAISFVFTLLLFVDGIERRKFERENAKLREKDDALDAEWAAKGHRVPRCCFLHEDKDWHDL